jgi:hypothetical protein
MFYFVEVTAEARQDCETRAGREKLRTLRPKVAERSQIPKLNTKLDSE